jgi:Uma2 family endonuclease
MSVAEPITTQVVTPPPRHTAPAPRPDPYENGQPDALFEVVNGVRVEKPMSVFESKIAGLLFVRLETHCEANRLGQALIETLFTIPVSKNDRKPDVAFVSFQTWPANRAIPRVRAWPIAPDLAVEVVSPTDQMFDVLAKLVEYFAGGVKQVWLVFSNVEQVYCYTSPTAVRILTRSDELTAEPLIPGFRLPLAELFPRHDEAVESAPAEERP